MKDIEEKISEAKTAEEFRGVFGMVYREFDGQKMSVDDFSWYCEQILKNLDRMKRTEIDSDLYDAVLAGSELEWYMRNSEGGQKLPTFLEKIHKYGKGLTEKEEKD